MTGSLGGYKYESQTTRALGSITPESYDYRDQGKTISKLVTDVSYMAGLQRKMQKGIDDANKNFVQQIQSLFTDLLVILGGSGDTGFDWGDLKYIFQAIGAMFGLQPGMGLPINIFSAAWHFFSNYILPVGNFEEAINVFIDSFIATALDIFGEVPIVGEALQQLAVIISNLRDSLGPVFDALENLFSVFDGDWASGAMGWFSDLMQGLNEIFSPIIGPVNNVLSQIFGIISGWTTGFVELLGDAVDVITNILRMVTGGLDYTQFNNSNFNPITVIATMIGHLIQNGILGIASALNADNIFGILRSWNIPFLPLAHLTNTAGPNLLVEPGFDDSDSIQLGVGWTWDNTQGHTSNGCAKATAGGFKREMVSIQVQCAEGDKFSVGGWLKWASIVYTGTPISVKVNKYSLSATGVPTFISADDILVPVAPATNQPTWLNLTGTYTVPAGVDAIRLSMQVSAATSAGNIWFDDFELKKQGTTVPQSWIANLVDDLTSLVNNLGTLTWNLLNNTGAVLGEISQGLITGLDTALNGLNSFIQNVIEGVIQAIKGVPFVGAGMADMTATLTGYKKDVKDVQVATKNFVMSSMAVTRQPGWVSDYSLCAATYPAILNSQFSVFSDTTGPATAGTAHTHALRGDGSGGDNARAVSAYWGYGPGRSVGGFVTPTEDMVFSGFSFTCYASATPVAGDFFFEVFRVNPDGSMIQLVSSDVSTFITTSGNTIDNSWNTFRCVAARGEKHLVRLRNASSSKTLSILGLQWRQGVPDIQWETNNSTDTNKTSYTSAEHDTISGNSIVAAWMQLKADDSDVPEAYTWTDDFERPTLGYFWDQSQSDTGGDLVISGGNLQYGGTTNGYQQGLYIRRLATDQFRCDVNLVSIASSGFTNIIVCGNRESNNYMTLSVGTSAVRLITVINGVSNTRVSVSKSSNDGKWSITYNTTTKVYTGYFNDVPVSGLTWTDSGDLMPKGPLQRFGHLQLQRTSGVNSGIIQDWQLMDWTP